MWPVLDTVWFISGRTFACIGVSYVKIMVGICTNSQDTKYERLGAVEL